MLFDVGPSRGVLIRNAQRAGVNLEEISRIFLSHPHGDHVGGISAFYPFGRKPEVYVPRGFSARDLEYLTSLGFQIEEVGEKLELGELKLIDSFGGWIPELVLLLPGGIMLTGCSHTGISRMVEKVLKEGEKIKVIIGGLHMFSIPHFRVKREIDRIFSMGVEKIAPLHCSGRWVTKYLLERFPERLLSLGSGSEVIF